MSTGAASPLCAILNRKQGTVRFGHALRLLGWSNPGKLQDLIDMLDTIHSRDMLIRVLAQVAQECAITKAKSKPIIIPDDEDLAYLLDDIAQCSAQTIAGLLIILSALRYPRRGEVDGIFTDLDATPMDNHNGEEHSDTAHTEGDQ